MPTVTLQKIDEFQSIYIELCVHNLSFIDIRFQFQINNIIFCSHN